MNLLYFSLTVLVLAFLIFSFFHHRSYKRKLRYLIDVTRRMNMGLNKIKDTPDLPVDSLKSFITDVEKRGEEIKTYLADFRKIKNPSKSLSETLQILQDETEQLIHLLSIVKDRTVTKLFPIK